MTIHLRFNLYSYSGPHPQAKMRELGIRYQHSTPQSMGDQWWFWNCENVPDPLPEFLEPMDNNPMECIGWGLSKAEAERIRDFKANDDVLRNAMERGIHVDPDDLRAALAQEFPMTGANGTDGKMVE
jgi:hypothetical protein